MKPLKAIVFDFDMTLVDSISTVIEFYQKTAEEIYKMQIETEKIRDLWGLPNDEMLKELFGYEKDVKEIAENIRAIRKKYNFGIKVFKDMENTLNYLKSRYLLGILTSTYTENVLLDLKFNVIDENLFDFIQGAEQTDYHKPDPKVFIPTLERLKKLDINTDEALYIGDSIDDFKASTGAGLNFIAVTTGMKRKEDFISEGLDESYIISQLSELPAKLN